MVVWKNLKYSPAKGQGGSSRTPPPVGGVIRNKCINTKWVYLGGKKNLPFFLVIESGHSGQQRALLLVTQGSCSASEVLTTAAVALGGMAPADVRQENLFTPLR